MKKKRKIKEKKYVLHLTCKSCGHKFTANRFRKYCTYECQREVNNQLAKNRYAEMREVYLKAKGVIE